MRIEIGNHTGKNNKSYYIEFQNSVWCYTLDTESLFWVYNADKVVGRFDMQGNAVWRGKKGVFNVEDMFDALTMKEIFETYNLKFTK